MSDEIRKCPFLTQTVVSYCSAFPIKKPIPGSSLSATYSPCTTDGHHQCPVYQDSAHLEPEPVRITETPPAQEMPECVWVRQDGVAYRLCTKDYNCPACSFEQMLKDRDGKYIEPHEVQETIKQLRQLPASQRRCKYMLFEGKEFREPCFYSYECWHCPTYQRLRKALQKV